MGFDYVWLVEHHFLTISACRPARRSFSAPSAV
jgi:alkanesulfonate monooxygenase SsuD/methylene tetrahydromethanopterin reductase-like flavin-dependent oxidoreductase (luciferase family)